jgi:hypothetical protein
LRCALRIAVDGLSLLVRKVTRVDFRLSALQKLPLYKIKAWLEHAVEDKIEVGLQMIK